MTEIRIVDGKRKMEMENGNAGSHREGEGG